MAKRTMTEAAKGQKWELILDKAAELLLEQSFEQIKMMELAQSLGMLKGTLFVYFKTKETLFLSLLWQEYQRRLVLDGAKNPCYSACQC